MNSNYIKESAKNFELLGAEMTVEFLYDNLRPVAKRSIVRNLIVAIISDIYDTSVVRICDAINFHRNSYYGVRGKIEEKTQKSEIEIASNIIRTYDLRENLVSHVCAADPKTIMTAATEILERLKIEEDVKAQILRLCD